MTGSFGVRGESEATKVGGKGMARKWKKKDVVAKAMMNEQAMEGS